MDIFHTAQAFKGTASKTKIPGSAKPQSAVYLKIFLYGVMAQVCMHKIFNCQYMQTKEKPLEAQDCWLVYAQF